jgi:CubicO group peptidase (beta-lactamase class C family)
MTPRDMLKFGMTYLNRGYWNGMKIIPEDWVTWSSVAYNNNKRINIPIEDSGKNGYGYTWWITEHDHNGKKISMYRANGWGGQTIMVIPDLEMVIVFTGGNYASRSSLFKLVNRYIIPSIE